MMVFAVLTDLVIISLRTNQNDTFMEKNIGWYN